VWPRLFVKTEAFTQTAHFVLHYHASEVHHCLAGDLHPGTCDQLRTAYKHFEGALGSNGSHLVEAKSTNLQAMIDEVHKSSVP